MILQSLFINFVLLLSITASFGAECPSKQALQDCDCDALGITCSGSNITNISDIFARISNNLTDSSDKKFASFLLLNTWIKEIPENAFHGVMFETISLYMNYNLTRIDANAFKSINHYVLNVEIDGSGIGDNPDSVVQTFQALSSLINIKTVTFGGSKVETIPERAFKNVSGIQDKLTKIDFWGANALNSRSIKTIGDYAFYDLPNLETIRLDRQQIDYVSANSFRFANKSNKTLEIYMEYNLLNATSFEYNALTNANRPIRLYLGINRSFEHFDEKVFAAFLRADQQNQIFISGGFDCDCRDKWLVTNKSQFKSSQIQGFICKNIRGLDIWNLTVDDFSNCL